MKESTGYMGNYGPGLKHWYHYGAVVIWTQQTNAQLLLEQHTQAKLEWIGYFKKISEQKAIAKLLLQRLYYQQDWPTKSPVKMQTLI